MSISQTPSLSCYLDRAASMISSGPEKAYDTAQAEAVVASARRYIGHIDGVSTDASLVSFDLIEGSVINDFRVLFEDVRDSMELFRGNSYDWVSYKHQLQEKKSRILEGGRADQPITPLRMNCWEFCLLVLVDAKIISQEEMTILCSICKSKDRGGGHDLIHVFQSEKGVKLTRENQHSLKAGDVLFDIRNNEKDERPNHMMMVSEAGKIIQNNAYPPDLHEKEMSFDFEYLERSNQKIVFLPFEQIRGNIEDFIRQHA